MTLIEALQSSQYDRSWGIWAKPSESEEYGENGGLFESSSARYGQMHFENDGLLDDYVSVCTHATALEEIPMTKIKFCPIVISTDTEFTKTGVYVGGPVWIDGKELRAYLGCDEYSEVGVRGYFSQSQIDIDIALNDLDGCTLEAEVTVRQAHNILSVDHGRNFRIVATKAENDAVAEASLSKMLDW